jgi:hypothetical protein
MQASEVIARFESPSRLYSRSEVVGRSSVVPSTSGIYGWYFDEMPAELSFRSEVATDGFRLLYVGIAPAGPSLEGRRQSTLRTRIRTHASGNADASTLRFTVGCLLSERLGIALMRTPSGRLRFGDGEAALSDWLDEHARVCWVEMEAAWSVEGEVVRGLDLPLNRSHNAAHPFYPILGEIRARERKRGLGDATPTHETGLAAGLETKD